MIRSTMHPQSMGITIAANNTSDETKAAADYVCDNVDDQVQFQAAFDKIKAQGDGYVQCIGAFRFHDTAYLPDQITIYGGGITVTSITNQTTDRSLFIYDASYWGEDTPGSFITFKDLTLGAAFTNPCANVVIANCKDAFMHGVFYSSGTDTFNPKIAIGMQIFNSWGAVLSNGTLFEFSSDIGLDVQTLGRSYTGTFDGNLPANVKDWDYPRAGDRISDAVTGAAGYIAGVDADALAVDIVQTTAAFFGAPGTFDIEGKTTKFTSAVRGGQDTQGGIKIADGKYMQNANTDIRIGDYVPYPMISNCEFNPNPSATGILLRGTSGALITGNRFNNIQSTARGIAIESPTVFENQGTAIQGNNGRLSGGIFLEIEEGNASNLQIGTITKGNALYSFVDPSSYTPFVDNGNGAAGCSHNLWKDNEVTDVTNGKTYSKIFESIPLRTSLATALIVSGAIYDNSGFVAAADYVLPAATVGEISFKILDTDQLGLKPASGETIIGAGVGTITDADTLDSVAIGSFVELTCFADGTWTVTKEYGTWTKG